MLGGAHFKRKIQKKERKSLAKKEAHVATAKKKGLPVDPAVAAAIAAAGAPHGTPIKKTYNRSTLKGPVVGFGGHKTASRDSGNNKALVPFRNKRDEKLYKKANRIPETVPIASTERVKKIGMDSRAQKRRFAKANGDDLLDQFRSKLQSSTFRLLNEQIYSSQTAYVSQLLRDPSTFEDYHKGYRSQLAQWPMNPNTLVVEALLGDRRGRFLLNRKKAIPGHIPPNWVIADMGCGEAQIAKAMTAKGYTVHAFDFVALNDQVTVSDSSNVPLENESVDVCVFSLSLMATDYMKSLIEAFRILRKNKLLKIVEVRSRVPHPWRFAELVEGIGFTCDWNDAVGDYFIAYDFIKKEQDAPVIQPVHPPSEVLIPSLYKKR